MLISKGKLRNSEQRTPKRNREPIPFKDFVLTLELSEFEFEFTQGDSNALI